MTPMYTVVHRNDNDGHVYAHVVVFIILCVVRGAVGVCTYMVESRRNPRTRFLRKER